MQRYLTILRRLITLTVIVLFALAIAILVLFLQAGRVKASHVLRFVATSSLVTSPTTLPSSASTSQSAGGIDPAIIAALIGVVGATVAALIAGGFAVYQVRRNAQLEQERLRMQSDFEEQRKAWEREQQRKEKEAEEIRVAQSIATHVKDYRNRLPTDLEMSLLQIPNMSRPLRITDVYVPIQLYQETQLTYKLDSALLEAEAERDPDAVLKASYSYLENRATVSINPDEAIRNYKHCVIVGDPGAGKTTLLKSLALMSVDNQLADLPTLPIYVDLYTFAHSEYTDLLEFASWVWESRYDFPKVEARQGMEEHLKAGKALLLLDGLDDAVIGETFVVANAIKQLAARYQHTPIVVTARKAVYQQRTPLTGFTELELPNFRLQDIREFVYRWFDYQTNLQKRKKTEDPDSMLACNPRIQILATNPLLLSLITTEYEAQRDLPNRRTELYQDCIDILLATWDSIRDIHRSSEFQTEHKRSLLEAVAWHLHINGRCYFSEGELLTVITGYLLREGLSSSDTRQILEAIVTENGLLKEYARGWYGFLYLTLQEYFVAKYAVNHNQLDTLLAHVGDPWWEEVISLYAGCIPDASSLLQKLLEQDKGSLLQEDIFYSNLILAGRCLATSSAVQQVSLRETVISHLFEVLTTTSYSLTQQRIVFILTEIGRTDVNARLQDLLSNQQVPPFVRWCIADLLNAQIPELASPSELQKHLYGSTYTFFDERIKGFSPFILLDIQQTDSTLLNRLEKALRLRDEQSLAVDLQSLFSNWRIDKYVRKHIAERLGLLGEQFLTRPLLQSLSDEQIHPQVRASIAFALGQIGDRSVSPTLLQLLLNEHIDLGLRTSIVFALGRLGERSVVNDLLQLLFNTKVSSANNFHSLRKYDRIKV